MEERLTERADGTIYCKDSYDKIINRLAEYEDLEEQGLIVRLPCKDWHRKYFIVQEEFTGKPTIAETHHWEWYTCARLCGVFYQNIDDDTVLFDYGKDMFDTYKEAEKKLKELRV